MAIDSFEDYYKFLGSDPSADEETIQAAFAAAQKKIEEARLYPNLHYWAIWANRLLLEAKEHLSNPAKRQEYDTLRARHYAEVRLSANLDAQILWLTPPYVFYTDDPDPAHTVPALARKLDTDWGRAIEEINERGLEMVLRHVGLRSGNLPPYEELRQRIAQVRESLGATHPRQMLESVIILCDQTIERPVAGIAGQSPGGFIIKPVVQRPDQAAVISFQLEHTGPRGALFGYLTLAETWGQITAPPLETFVVDGQSQTAARFELAPSEKVTVTVTVQSAQLMELKRPALHSLTAHLHLQPGTAHKTERQIALSLDVTSIPAKAQFTPATITLPIVQRGKPVTGMSTLVNQGELPLHARCVGASDQGVTIQHALLPDGGEVQVTVDTRDLREGSRYQKWVKFQADGDVPEVTLWVQGELAPTAMQHFFRQRSAEKRISRAVFFGLVGSGLSLFTLLANSGWLLWVIWISCTALLTAGIAGSIARTVLKHRQATSEKRVSLDSTFWNRLYLGVGGATAVFALIMALVSLDPGTKALLFWPIFALACAAWGFFQDEASAPTPSGNKPSS